MHTEVLAEAKSKYPGYSLETQLYLYYYLCMAFYTSDNKQVNLDKMRMANLIMSAIDGMKYVN